MTASAMEVIRDFADWSRWVPFTEARVSAPREPGVYLAREGPLGALVYVGMAGERRGQGIRGRLTIYSRGRALASGLGEAVFDRALQDALWLHQRLTDLQQGTARRAKEWGVLAFERANLHMCWTVTTDRATAADLENRILAALEQHNLWNRRR